MSSKLQSDFCFLARVASSGECLGGKSLVWLVGAVMCLLAACRGSNCPLTNAIDGRNLRCSTIGSCKSTTTSYYCTARLVTVIYCVSSALRIRPLAYILKALASNWAGHS